MSNYWSKVDKKGFVLIQSLLSEEEVNLIRNKLDYYFKDKPQKRMLNLEETISNIDLIEQIQLNTELLSTLDSLFSIDNWNYVNDFQLIKNMSSKKTGGWHADINSQYSKNPEKKKLDLENYKFLKIGIYLQDKKCPYGSSIEVIPYSYLLPQWAYSLTVFLLNRKFLGKLGNLFSRKIDLDITAGDCIIFDSRLIHRSSFSNLSEKMEITSYSEGVFKEHTDNNKYALYFEAGDPSSCKQFLNSNLSRAKDDSFFSNYLSKDKSYYFTLFSSNYKKHLSGRIACLEKKEDLAYAKSLDQSHKKT